VESKKKLASVNIDFTKDNILPELNRDDLAETGKVESKPILLKKSVIERNKARHSEISINKYNRIIGETLYNKDFIMKEKNPEKPNYYHFHRVTLSGFRQSMAKISDVHFSCFTR
jgi:hypothetical protein